MTGVEIAVGYFVAWAVRKARRVGAAADKEVDRALDATVERVHDLISSKIGAEPAVQQLEEELHTGEGVPNARTRQRIALAVEDAVEKDAGFAVLLERLVGEVRELEKAAGGVSADEGSVAAGRDITVHADAFKAEQGSVAAFVVRDVNLGNPTKPGSGQQH